MKIRSLISLIFLSLLVSSKAYAEQVTIENSWIREAPPTLKVLAGYLTIHNHGEQDLTLICAQSSKFADVMFHKTSVVEEVAKMQHVDEIKIPAGESFSLSPGGFHLMLMGRKTPLKAGDEVDLTLTFKEIDDKKIITTVKKFVAE